MTADRRPRLSEIPGLRVECDSRAIDEYRHDVDETMTRAMAHRDLVTTILDGYITDRSGTTVAVRSRNRSLSIDMIARLTELSPTLLRCDHVQVRGVRRSGGQRSSDLGLVRRVSGIGSVRLTPPSTLEWRDHGSEEWRPTTPEEIVRRCNEPNMWLWLASHGVARPEALAPATAPRGATPAKERLHTIGTVYVTLAAAEQYLRACPRLSGVEAARRELTERMLDGHMVDDRKARARSQDVDITAIVVREGRLLVVTTVDVAIRTYTRRMIR